MRIYLFGPPCGGKSTLAEGLAKKYGLVCVHGDDTEGPFLSAAALEGPEAARHLNEVLARGKDAMWLRSPEVLLADETAYYRETFGKLMDWTHAQGEETVAESAAYLPGCLASWGIPQNRALGVFPTEAFRLSRYAERPWVKPYLADCSDPDTAYRNWMARDGLMGALQREEAEAAGYPILIQDGTRTPEETLAEAVRLLGL